MNTPDSSGWSQRTQGGIDASSSAGFEMRNATQRGSIASPSAKRSRSATAPGARRSPRISAPSSRSMMSWLRSSWVSALGTRPPSVDRGGEGGQHVLVEEVGERPVAHVVEQAGDPQRFDDQPLGRDAARRRARRALPATDTASAPTAPPRASRPRPCVNRRVLGGREDPARRLQLADPAEPLQPSGVEEVLLGDVLVEQPRGAASRPASAAW